MPAKIIICAPGRPVCNGHKRRMFIWNPTFNAYVFEDRVLDEAEFNRISESVFKKHSDIRPYAKIVQESVSVVPEPMVPEPMVPEKDYAALKEKYRALQARIGEIPPVATIAAREVGLDEAVAIVQRLAPEKLRKTSQGRRPNVVTPEPAMEVG